LENKNDGRGSPPKNNNNKVEGGGRGKNSDSDGDGDDEGGDGNEKCLICLKHESRYSLLPCGHRVVCEVCVGEVDTCQKCFTPVESYQRAL